MMRKLRVKEVASSRTDDEHSFYISTITDQFSEVRTGNRRPGFQALVLLGTCSVILAAHFSSVGLLFSSTIT